MVTLIAVIHIILTILAQPVSLVSSLRNSSRAQEWPIGHGLWAYDLYQASYWNSLPQFTHLHNGATDGPYLMELLWRWNELMHIKLLKQHLAHGGRPDVHCCYMLCRSFPKMAATIPPIPHGVCFPSPWIWAGPRVEMTFWDFRALTVLAASIFDF